MQYLIQCSHCNKNHPVTEVEIRPAQGLQPEQHIAFALCDTAGREIERTLEIYRPLADRAH
jgi:hypothetical protein